MAYKRDSKGRFVEFGALKPQSCLCCSKSFNAYGTRKYCSQMCYQKMSDPTSHLLKDVKGEKNPFYGKKHGKHFQEVRSGEKHWNWKGGISTETIKERMRFVQEVGRTVLARDGYTCQLCGNKKDLQVDHIQKWSEYAEGRFSVDNCRTLCRPCHYRITYGREMPKDSKWGIYHFRKEILA